MNTLIVEKWNVYLDYFDDEQKDIYYLEEYVKLYETIGTKALCAICEDNGKYLLMPYIRKEISEGYYDFETAYGYGGPIANNRDTTWINIALNEMDTLLQKNHYVCGFIRFHPILDNAKLCTKNVNVIFDRKTVVIKTNETENDIWANQITSKNRNMIRKAEKNGLEYKAEYGFESIEEFIDLYNSTMKRLDADRFYFFNDQYYRSFVENFKGKAFLGTVSKNNEVICAALFMYTKEYGHYHLEGSNSQYSKLAANNFLLWRTTLELHNLGIKEFHLGGGYDTNPENSLLKFKQSFSSNTYDFYIGKWIFNQEKYDDLRNMWRKTNPDKVEKYGKLLLCYRY